MRARHRPENHPNNCKRRKFVRTPASCILPRRSATTRIAATSGSSTLIGDNATPAANLHARSGAPPASSLTLATNAGAAGGRFSSLVANASHGQLLALGIVVALVSSGIFVACLRRNAPKVTGSRADRKRKDNALRKIVQAQEAASRNEDAAKASAPSGLSRRPSSQGVVGSAGSSSAPAPESGTRPTLSRINTAVGESLAAAAELLPSPACVTSSSAVIWSGIERIGNAFGAASAGRNRSTSTSKGKEREAEQSEERDAVTSSQRIRRRESSKGGAMTQAASEGTSRKGKGKKGGKGASGTASASMSPAPSSQGFASALASPAISRRGSARVDADPASVGGPRNSLGLPGDFPNSRPSSLVSEGASPVQATAQFDRSPQLVQPPPPAKRMTEVAVQTSPRLLPLPDSPVLAPTAAENSERGSVPILVPRPLAPFDLHAAFQAPTNLSTSSPPLRPLDTYSMVAPASSAYLPLVSPPMSPSLSRSPSAAASTSSGSPASRRESSPSLQPSPTARMRPLPSLPRRASSTVFVNGLLAVSAPDGTASSGASSSGPPISRSRKAARKARNNEATTVNGVVGLPGAVAAPRRSSEAEKGTRGRDADGKGARTPGSEDSPTQRRMSAASSGTSARSGSKNVDSRRPSEEAQFVHAWPPTHDGFPYSHGTMAFRTLDDDVRSEAASDIEGRSSSAAGDGFGGRFGGHYMSPDSSPHPSQRSLSSSQYGFGSSRAPWSPHLVSQQPGPQPLPVTMASPASTSASRPPSRGSSLSVPVALTPMAPVASPQQQAYALAQAQLQTQSQLLQHYQQIAALQMQQRPSQSQPVPPLRRRATSGGLSETSDGFLSPTATATPATPNGFSYPFGAYPSSPATSAPHSVPGWSVTHSGPLAAQYLRHASGPPSPYPTLSQSASPTTVTFPNGPTGPYPTNHTLLSSQNGPYSPAANSVSGYLASPSSAYGAVQPSPTHAYFNAPHAVQQQQRASSLPYGVRPRLASSVSASATVGASSGKNAPPLSASVSSVHSNGTSSKSRNGGERSQSIPSAPLSGGVPLGDPPPSGWKGKLKQAELDADRMGKELEIARWRLAVVEEEQRTAERESQEALKVLAARAMRAEARIKLFEATARANEASGKPEEAAEEPSQDGRSGSPEASPRPPPTQGMVAQGNDMSDAVLDEGLPRLQLNGTSDGDDSVGKQAANNLHPLAWLDLDAVSFGSSLPSRQPGSALLETSTSGPRRRNGRNGNSGVDFSRRRPGAGVRRKSGLIAQGPPAANPEGSDEEEVVIVLDAPLHRRAPPKISVSRRSSYAGEAGNDNSSYGVPDEDDSPAIDYDDPAQPLAGGIVIADDGSPQHPEYIGFLPAYLSLPRQVTVVAGDDKIAREPVHDPPSDGISPDAPQFLS